MGFQTAAWPWASCGSLMHFNCSRWLLELVWQMASELHLMLFIKYFAYFLFYRFWCFLVTYFGWRSLLIMWVIWISVLYLTPDNMVENCMIGPQRTFENCVALHTKGMPAPGSGLQLLMYHVRASQGCSGCTCTPGVEKKILGVIYGEDL